MERRDERDEEKRKVSGKGKRREPERGGRSDKAVSNFQHDAHNILAACVYSMHMYECTKNFVAEQDVYESRDIFERTHISITVLIIIS